MTSPRPEHRLLALALPGIGARPRAEMAAIAATGPDWSRVLADADRIGALAILGPALAEAGIHAPPSVVRACREALVQGTLRGMLAARVLAGLLEILRARGVDALVLKGVPLAHELYADPGLRPIGDIDLLVRRRDRETALLALQDAGYRLPVHSLALDFYRRHHFHVTLARAGAEGLPLELHWDAQPAFSRSRIPEDGLWARSRMVTCGASEIPVPGREECFLYLAQHLIRHLLVFGAETARDPVAALLEPARRGRLTWIADLVLLCRRAPGLDWALVDRRAAEWGLDTDIAGLRRFLVDLGVATPRPASGLPVPGEGRLRLVRAFAALVPAAAQATDELQFRPLLAVELLRHAFPGGRWIRWRYGIDPARGGVRVAAVGVRHAAGVLARAGRMGAAVVWGRLSGSGGGTYTRGTVPGAA